MDCTPPPDAFSAQGYSWGRHSRGIEFKPVLHDSHFRLFHITANSHGQCGGDIVPGVLAQCIIMMHSRGKLFSFHYNVELKRNP